MEAKGVGIHDPYGADDPFLDEILIAAANGGFGYASLSGDLGERGTPVFL
jgi:hypothetical protein